MTNEQTPLPEGHRILVAVLCFIAGLFTVIGLNAISEIPKALTFNQALTNFLIGIAWACMGYALRATKS